MKNNILFFSIDRLGDYLIRSNVIKKISENYDDVEIIGSEKNFKLLNSQKIFNKIYLFNTQKKITEKIRFIYNFFLKKYHTIIVFDGKNISNLLLIFMRSKSKFTFLYKKGTIINKVYLQLIAIIYKIFNIKYEILYNRDQIEKNCEDNYPNKYKNLKKYFSNIEDEIYYLEKSNISTYNMISNEYILIHLDEKFNDIFNIKNQFESSIVNFQKKINKKIILTTFNNNNDYYKNITIDKIDFSKFNIEAIINNKIIIIENMPINHFQNLIENSFLNISCHSGLFVHTSLALYKRTFDIINESDQKWLNSWIIPNNLYHQIYKSNNQQNFDINKILENIYEKQSAI